MGKVDSVDFERGTRLRNAFSDKLLFLSLQSLHFVHYMSEIAVISTTHSSVFTIMSIPTGTILYLPVNTLFFVIDSSVFAILLQSFEVSPEGFVISFF